MTDQLRDLAASRFNRPLVLGGSAAEYALELATQAQVAYPSLDRREVDRLVVSAFRHNCPQPMSKELLLAEPRDLGETLKLYEALARLEKGAKKLFGLQGIEMICVERSL